MTPYIPDTLEIALAPTLFSQENLDRRAQLLSMAEIRMGVGIPEETRRMLLCLQVLAAQVWLDPDSKATVFRLTGRQYAAPTP